MSQAAESDRDDQANEPTELTYDEHLHPARPRALRFRPRVKAPFTRRSVARTGPRPGTTRRTCRGCCRSRCWPTPTRSASSSPARARCGRTRTPTRDPRHAVDTGVGVVHRLPAVADHPPRRVVPRPRWATRSCGRRSPRSASRPSTPARSSGPAASRAGSTRPASTATSTGSAPQIDPAFGTEDEFRAMCGMATWYGGTIIDDIVPGHTGKGADFRLAEMKYADYPGIYHMVEIDPERLGRCCPTCPPGRDSVNIDAATEERLEKAGYIIGRLQRVIFYAEGVKETNWSATAPGRRHRRRRAPLGVPALLQGRPALDQLAGPVVRRDAAGHRRRPALAGRPRLRRAAAGRQRLPRRGEERRRAARPGRRGTRCPRRPTT